MEPVYRTCEECHSAVMRPEACTAMKFKPVLILLLLLAGVAGCAHRDAPASGAAANSRSAQGVSRTGLLEAVAGERGDLIGAEVSGVSLLSDADIQAIEIEIPLDSTLVDRVEVISPSGDLIGQSREAEIVRGEANGTDVRIFLPRRSNWQFRLRLIDVENSD